MKRLLIVAIALLLVVPMVAFADTITGTACDKTKNACVIIPYENDDRITEVPNEEEGTIIKTFPVYVEQPTETEVKSAKITIKNKESGIVNVAFDGESPYVVAKDADTATFSVPSGTAGSKDKKILLGKVIVTVNAEDQKCGFNYEQKIEGVKTGSFVNYAVFGLGALLVAGIYTATRSKKKMYNI